MGEEIALDVSSREVSSLNGTFYASIEYSQLEWKRLNGEIEEKNVFDEDVFSTD